MSAFISGTHSPLSKNQIQDEYLPSFSLIPTPSSQELPADDIQNDSSEFFTFIPQSLHFEPKNAIIPDNTATSAELIDNFASILSSKKIDSEDQKQDFNIKALEPNIDEYEEMFAIDSGIVQNENLQSSSAVIEDTKDYTMQSTENEEEEESESECEEDSLEPDEFKTINIYEILRNKRYVEELVKYSGFLWEAQYLTNLEGGHYYEEEIRGLIMKDGGRETGNMVDIIL
ncbi:hypothetical protein HK096_005669 [Nowakowskiella sp. JEL0078]|nr:hypothetical protein HK096_005669 [Nowakowskiella sp. JEL0078]